MIHFISGDRHSCLQYINSLAGDLTEYTLTKNITKQETKQTKKKTKKTTSKQAEVTNTEQTDLTPEQRFWRDLTLDYLSSGLFSCKKLLLILSDNVVIPEIETLPESDNHLIIWKDNVSADDKRRLKQLDDIIIKEYSGLEERYATAGHLAIIKRRFPEIAVNVADYLKENLPRDKFGLETQLNIFPSPKFGIGTAKYLVPLASNTKALAFAYFMGDMVTVFDQFDAFDREGSHQPGQILRGMIFEFRKLSRIVIAGKKDYDTVSEILISTSNPQYYLHIDKLIKTPPSLKDIAVRYTKLIEAIVNQNIHYLY